MDFGKISNANNARFDLPPDLPRSTLALGKARAKAMNEGGARNQAFLGCPIWAQKEWVGSVYPPGTKPKDFLRHYSRQFNAIELNVTHYRMPDSKTIADWRSQVPPTFRFCPKWPQDLSHDRMLRGCDDQIRKFCEETLGLKGNLGLSFLQLPPGFAPQYLTLLDHFLSVLPQGFPVAVEFRHPAWFTKAGGLHNEALNVLESWGASTVITDTGGRRDASHASLTNGAVLIRFLGNGLHPTDFTRIDEWATRLARWFDQGLQHLYFFAHEPDNIKAPELSNYIVERFNEVCGLDLKPWVPVKPESDPQDQQISLF